MAESKTIVLPDVGDFQDIEIIEILVAPGDVVEQEQSIIVLESDKATMEIPSPYAGTIEALNVSVGDRVNEGDAIASLKTDAAAEKAGAVAEKDAVPEAPAAQPESAAAAETPAEAEAPAPAPPGGFPHLTGFLCFRHRSCPVRSAGIARGRYRRLRSVLPRHNPARYHGQICLVPAAGSAP